VATTIGKELAAAQLRNQTANLETWADQLEEQGANPQLIQIISQRTEDLNDRADLLDPQDPCANRPPTELSTNLNFSYPIHNPLFLFSDMKRKFTTNNQT
jgi:hypothetical protein